MAGQSEKREAGGLLDQLPMDELKDQTRQLMSALGEQTKAVATEKVGGIKDRVLSYAKRRGEHKEDESADGAEEKPKATDKVKNLLSGAHRDGDKKSKSKTITITEEIEVGIPVWAAYNQWTQFQDFPKFAEGVENVEQKNDEKLTWKAGIFLAHRTWESTIIDQVPDELIVWRSKGDKGYIDGTVTFHEIAANLTKILMVLEYHPQGLVERTGSLFGIQRRRAHGELEGFRRYAMTTTVLDPEAVEGWRGEIRDSEVLRSHEEALEESESASDEGAEDAEEDEGAEEDEDEYADEEPEGESEANAEDQESEDEDEDDDVEDEEPPEDEGEESAEDEYEADEEQEGEDARPTTRRRR